MLERCEKHGRPRTLNAGGCGDDDDDDDDDDDCGCDYDDEEKSKEKSKCDTAVTKYIAFQEINILFNRAHLVNVKVSLTDSLYEKN